MRDIAKQAGVSPMLLFRYFDSKMELFEAALYEAVPANLTFTIDVNTLGTTLAEFFTVAQDSKAAGILTMCIGDSEAQEVTQRVTEERFIKPLAAGLPRPNARDRAVEILMLTMGFIVYTRFIPLSQDGSASRKRLMKWFADSVQDIVDKK